MKGELRTSVAVPYLFDLGQILPCQALSAAVTISNIFAIQRAPAARTDEVGRLSEYAQVRHDHGLPVAFGITMMTGRSDGHKALLIASIDGGAV